MKWRTEGDGTVTKNENITQEKKTEKKKKQKIYTQGKEKEGGSEAEIVEKERGKGREFFNSWPQKKKEAEGG